MKMLAIGPWWPFYSRYYDGEGKVFCKYGENYYGYRRSNLYYFNFDIGYEERKVTNLFQIINALFYYLR